MLQYIYFQLVLQFLLPILYTNAENLKVCLTDLGCLQGTHLPGFQTEQFEAFMGIPYAKPPIGNLRLKNPEPITPWEGDLAVTTPKSDCLQKQYLLPTWPITGDEDCLYLNVYRPMQHSAKKLPVLLYFHSGGLFCGSPNLGQTGPEFFMDTQEVILVTVTYRLGPFGFLSTGDEVMPGNFGLKDQNLALQWVHKYIAEFDGDPNAVTIFGHSAGAASVHFHQLSAASMGLFQQAITMSGSALAHFVRLLEAPLAQAVRIADACGLSNAAGLSTSELVEFIRQIDGKTLLNAGDSLKFWNINPLMNFRPVLEDASWTNAFLTVHPQTAFNNGNFTHVPHMMGLMPSNGEGAVIALNIVEDEQLRQEFNNDFNNFMEQMMEFPKGTTEEFIKISMDMVMEEYLNGNHNLNNETKTGFMELMGDFYFYHPYYKMIKYQLNQNIPLHLFRFDYRGTHSYSSIFNYGNMDNFGAVHVDDLIYLFREPAVFPDGFAKDSIDAAMAKEYVDFYVEFAKTGKVSSFNNVPQCTVERFNTAVVSNTGICDYLQFMNDDKAGYSKRFNTDFPVKRMHLWDKILGN